MYKAMAIEAIMKLILMIAVIVVGMAFLMKAFGIDLFGWLQNLLGGLGLSDGPALYVRLDTNPGNIYDFRLTNNKLFLVDDESNSLFGPIILNFKSYFYLSDFPKNKCTILTAEYNGGKNVGGKFDRGGIFQVSPGTTLQDECNSIEGCIEKIGITRNLCDFREGLSDADICAKRCNLISDGEIKEGNCASESSYVDCNSKPIKYISPIPPFTETLVSDIQLYKNYLDSGVANFLGYRYNYCDYQNGDTRYSSESSVLTAPFNDDQGWQCSGNNCNLLDQGNKLYKIKYGIICGTDGIWHTCKKGVPNLPNPGFEASCSGSGENIFTWSITKKIETKIECVFPETGLDKSFGCIFDRSSADFDSTIGVCGKLVNKDGSPLAGRILTLERLDAASGVFKPIVKTAETEADGTGCVYGGWVPGDSFKSTVYKYRLKFDEESAYQAATTKSYELII